MDPSKRLLSDRQANSTVLKQHYITPAEVQVPVLRSKDVIHKAVAVQEGGQRTVNQEDVQRFDLDGFFMLEATGMGFPEDAQQALIADCRLVSVVEDDMSYFTEMLHIDASENSLELAPFGVFPKLHELHLACNLIDHIPQELFGFENLTCLDLSYNRLNVESIQALEALPNLKDLDLSGNKLREIPDDWQHYKALEKLLLDYNLLENNDVFTYISSAPNLRHLSVYDNHLSVFPEVALAFEGFRVLDTLDLACNYFSAESNVEPATRLPRIATIKLYGNPLLGETGEDPIYIYIEGLVDDSIAHREVAAPHLPNIDFITEFPKPKTMKKVKGQPLGRQAAYRDFAIVQVDNAEVQTQRQWRERGNQSIFAETIQHKRKKGAAGLETGLGASGSASSLPDGTFLTSSHALSPSGGLAAAHGGGGAGHLQGLHGHVHHPHAHGADKTHDVVADDVMQRVAGDMGLVTSAELLILQDRVGAKSSVLNFLRKDLPFYDEEDEEDFDIGGGGQGGGGGGDAEHSNLTSAQRREMVQQRVQQEQERELQRRMQDQVPGGLFKQQMGDATVLAPQPIALKTALKALQQAIAQPLTNYDELPSKSIMFPSKDYYKPTRSSIIRQMPRHSLATTDADGQEGRGHNSDEEDAAEMARYVGAPGVKVKKVPAAPLGLTGGFGNNNVSSGASVHSGAGSLHSNGTGHHSQRSGSPNSRKIAAQRAASAEATAKPKTSTSHKHPAATATGMEKPDIPANRYMQRGLKESSTVRALRQEQREQTLQQIEEVLQGLNANTTGWSEKQALQAVKNANFRGHAAKNEKETMREMRDFAQPFTGVKSLLNMVNDIEEEFNS